MIRITLKSYKAINWQNAKIKLFQYMYICLLKSSNFDAANIKCFTIYESLGDRYY